MQFAALFVVIGALVSDNRDGKFICISLGIMAVSLIGRIITTYFSTMEQTETGYCMVAEKRIHIGDPFGYSVQDCCRGAEGRSTDQGYCTAKRSGRFDAARCHS